MSENLQIAAKAYGLDSSAEEIRALKARVSQLAPNTFLFKEVPIQSIFQLDVMFGRLYELTANLDRWYLVVDISETSIPSADVRANIRNRYVGKEVRNLKHVFLITKDNMLIALAARFVAGKTIKVPYTIVRTFNQALEKLSLL